MSLPVLATAALLLGSAVVLTVVATTPAGETPAAGQPPSASSGRTAPANGRGLLEVLVHSEGDAGKAHLTATRATGEVVYAEVVDLPARSEWRLRLEVPRDAYRVALQAGPTGSTSGDGDLRDCLGGHALWEARIRLRGPLAQEVGSRGASCVEGYAAREEEVPAAAASASDPGTGAMRASQTITLAYTGPTPTCLPPECEGVVSVGGSVVRFGLDRPARMTVRADWDPVTPAAERLGVHLWRGMADGAGEYAGGGEGARRVVFELEAVPGDYTFIAQPDGPVGAAVSQHINYEATWVYR